MTATGRPVVKAVYLCDRVIPNAVQQALDFGDVFNAPRVPVGESFPHRVARICVTRPSPLIAHKTMSKPMKLEPGEPIPHRVMLLCVEGDSTWDRIPAYARTDTPDVFAPTGAKLPRTRRAGALPCPVKSALTLIS